MFYLLIKNKIKIEPPDLSRSDWNHSDPSRFRADSEQIRVDSEWIHSDPLGLIGSNRIHSDPVGHGKVLQNIGFKILVVY